MKKWLLLISLFIVAIVLTGQVRYEKSDSRYILLEAESLVQQGSLQLDSYCNKKIKCDNNYRIMKLNGHYFYGFPLGTPLISIPLVATANALGFNIVENEEYMQRALVILSLTIIFLLLVKIANLFLPPKSSTIISAIFVFGTSIMGTMGSALWSHNFAMVFALLAIYFTLSRITQIPYIKIATCLFLAYLCRPTLFLLSPCLLLFIFTYNKRSALYCASALLLMTSCFIGFSYLEFNTFLPPYYLGTRLTNTHFIEAFIANLLSPSRGLFIFSPFLLVFLLFIQNNNLKQIKKSWLLLGIVWPLLHLITVSRFPNWWGGYSFGPRLMTDILPGLFLLAVAVWPKSFKKAAAYILACAVAFSVYVNTYKGRYDIDAAIHWNKKYANSNSLFDWSIAQCLY